MHYDNEVILKDRHGVWHHFADPLEIVAVDTIDEVLPALHHIDKEVSKGYYAAGFVAYEATPAFDAAYCTHSQSELPLLWFGIYVKPRQYDITDSRRADCIPFTWHPDTSRQEYIDQIQRIKNLIQSGDTYQVNHTFRMHATEPVDWQFFRDLFAHTRNEFTALINTEGFSICSASPELFFELDGDTITCRPMKGTRPRGRTADEDRALCNELISSEKDRAENLMIVDMIRNDLGKIAHVGTVRVNGLFDIEKYNTVWQMTSTVQASTDCSFVEIFRALFPCASITGASKVRTMQIIEELEKSPRGVYTGAIGYCAPDRYARFSVAIRTAVIDKRSKTVEYGTGSGIVWDSDPEDEYDECIAKTRIVRSTHPQFELLETMLYRPRNGVFLCDYHMERLQESAEYFSFPCDTDSIRDALRAIDSESYLRLRLLLTEDGSYTVEQNHLTGNPQTVQKTRTVSFAVSPVSQNDVFLYHKTTHRHIYETARGEIPDCDDVTLWNEHGEVTESRIANIVIELHGKKYTPPVQCGLLAGTFRRHIIERGDMIERVIFKDDLRRADRIWLINSVRAFMPARLIE